VCICIASLVNISEAVCICIASLVNISEAVCICIASLVNVRDEASSSLTERNTPPRGGFLSTMLPHQEPCVRGPPSKNLVQILPGGPLTHGSWSGKIVNRKPPRGGGFLSINMRGNRTRPHQYKPCHIHGKAYVVATISRLLKMIGLFCKISSLL